ncbi:MAG: hypothetical protein RL385_4930 [Pseudomonadota bacterium]
MDNDGADDRTSVEKAEVVREYGPSPQGARVAGVNYGGEHVWVAGGTGLLAIQASGLAWAEGALWRGEYGGRANHELDPDTASVLRTIRSNRYVTGVTWVEGELWHGTWESDKSEIQRVDPENRRVLERLPMPECTARRSSVAREHHVLLRQRFNHHLGLEPRSDELRHHLLRCQAMLRRRPEIGLFREVHHCEYAALS